MLPTKQKQKVFINLIKDIKTILTIDHCPIVHPCFIFAYSNDTISKTHRQALNIKGSKRLLPRIFYMLYWPIRAIHLASTGTINYERQRRVTGLSRLQFFLQLWRYMCRYNIKIDSYFMFRLWLPDNKKRAKDYIQLYEIIDLLAWLNRDKNVKDIDNKVCFEALCHKHKLPTPEIYATCSSEGAVMKTGNLPEADLFIKTDEMWGGIGAQSWYFDKQKRAWKHDNLVLKETDLLKNLCDNAKDMTTLVQLKLNNGHPFDTLSSGALCTFRVITFKLPNEKTRHYSSVLRMPTGNSEVDNFTAGGIAAGIDDTGRLKSAIGKYDGYNYIDTHPDTGCRINGEILTCWKQVVDLAKNSHNLITDIYTVGWDIAWTDSGAIIIEANMGWGSNLIQMAHDEPFGQEFCDLFWSAAQGGTSTG